MHLLLRLPLLFALICLAASSCTLQSLHALYINADVLRDQTLIGAWADQDGALAWEFGWASDDNDPTYHITYYEDDTSTELDGRLIELAGMRLLDLSPHDGQSGNLLGTLLHVPVHTVMRIGLDGDVVQLQVVDIEWLGSYLEKHPDEIAHVWQTGSYEGMPLLTAETPEVRRFIEKHSGDDGFWGGPLQLQRIPAPTALETATAD
jgi:hypothetical protein